MKLFGSISATIVSFALGISVPAYAQQDQHEPQPQHEQQQQPKEKPAEPAEKHAQEEPKKAQPNPKEQQHQGQQEKAQQEKVQQEKAQQEKTQQEKVQQDKSAMQDKRQTEQEKAQQNKNAQRDNSMQQAKPSAQQNVQRSGGKEVKTETRTTEKVKVEKTTFQAHRATNWKVDHRNWQQRGGYHGYRIPEVRFRTYFGPEHYFRIAGLPFVVVSGNPRFQYNGFWFTLVDPWPEYWAADWYDTDDVYVAYVDDGYYMFDRRYPTEGIAINISL